MDELKQRLEYLEHITKAPEHGNNLLEQVDTIGFALNTMVDVHKQEVTRLAQEVNKQAINSSQRSAVESGPPSDVKNDIILSRFEDIARLADDLEMHSSLNIPEAAAKPNVESLISRASELGREFDRLALRSAELTKSLSEKIIEENEHKAEEVK